jgi:hypothetical protein
LTCPTTDRISGGVIYVRWLQAGWTIVVQFSDDTTLPTTVRAPAEAVATQLTTTALPADSGLLEINEAGDGQHTEAAWVIGSNIYVAFNDHLRGSRRLARFGLPAPRLHARGSSHSKRVSDQ